MIADSAFGGQGEISVDDLSKVSVRSFNEVPDKFLKGWDETPRVLSGLTLSNDNSVIEDASPVVLGKIPEQTFPANRFWELKEELTLNFEALDLTKFNFKDSMTSELVDHFNIGYTVVNKQGVVITGDSLKAQGFLGFSLRLFLQPISTTDVKITVLCYPLSLEQLKKTHPLYDNHAFPGILMISVKANLGLVTTDFIKTKFGSPILPVIKISKSLATYDQIPTSRQICVAISILLRSVTVPEIKSSYKLLLERWNEIKVKGVISIRLLIIEVIWPEVAPSLGMLM